MSNNSLLEKGVGTDSLSAVDDLVGDDKVTRTDVLLEGTDGGEGEDGADSDGAESGDVGEVGDLGRGELVVDSVAGQEGDGNASGGAEDVDGRGGSAPGGGGGEDSGGNETVVDEGLNSGTTDDGDVDGL